MDKVAFFNDDHIHQLGSIYLDGRGAKSVCGKSGGVGLTCTVFTGELADIAKPVDCPECKVEARGE